jgi:hypothetical protein
MTVLMDFCPWVGLVVLSMCSKFQRKQVFPSRDNKFAGKVDFFYLSVKCEYFLQGRNFVIRFLPKSLAIGQKSSKTVIALERKPISAYPFRLFLLSPGPTYGHDITSNAIYKLVTLPGQFNECQILSII